MICATCHTEIRPSQEATPSLLRTGEIQHARLGDCLDNLRAKNEALTAALQGLQRHCQEVVPRIAAGEGRPGEHLERLPEQAEKALIQ